MATKRDRLSRLRERMEADSSLPLRAGATHLVFGEGNPDAALYLLGEAPGRAEDTQGRPFVGQAGRLLTRLLERNGLRRDEVYLSNLVRFRPPHNRPPTSAEIAAFSPYVDEELSILQPVLIVTLGRFATRKFLPVEKLTQAHGTLKTVIWQGKPVHIFPVYHPAAALRSPQIRLALEEDLEKIPSLLRKLLPPQKD